MGTGLAKLLGVSRQVEDFRNRRAENKLSRLIKNRNRTKVFCIGRNKTGTTSLETALGREGYIIGNQKAFEKLGKEFRKGDYTNILELCRYAEGFQDFPFSYPEMYKVLDEHFPGSKFILTLRYSSEEWYSSLTRFHAKLFGQGVLPTKEQLIKIDYIEEGWMWENFAYLFGTPDLLNPYEKNRLIKHYEDYNAAVINYFKERQDDLLVINLSEADSFNKFITFLGVSSEFLDFPWENKTDAKN